MTISLIKNPLLEERGLRVSFILLFFTYLCFVLSTVVQLCKDAKLTFGYSYFLVEFPCWMSQTGSKSSKPGSESPIYRRQVGETDCNFRLRARLSSSIGFLVTFRLSFAVFPPASHCFVDLIKPEMHPDYIVENTHLWRTRYSD